METCPTCGEDASRVSHRCERCQRRCHAICGQPITEGYGGRMRCDACSAAPTHTLPPYAPPAARAAVLPPTVVTLGAMEGATSTASFPTRRSLRVTKREGIAQKAATATATPTAITVTTGKRLRQTSATKGRTSNDTTMVLHEVDGDARCVRPRAGLADPLAPFDADNFLAAMSAEQLFDGPAEDDVNVVAVGADDEFKGDGDMESEPSGSELEDDDPFDFDDLEDANYDNDGVPDIGSVSFSEVDDVAATKDYVSRTILDGIEWKSHDPAASRQVMYAAAGDLYDGPSGPTKSAVAFAGTPLGMFFYFLPKQLWTHIAQQTNKYRIQHLPGIAEDRHAKMVARNALDPTVKVKSIEEILDELKTRKPIETHELFHYIGLLIARVLTPHRNGLHQHWATKADGATPQGTFGKYMARQRFEEISRFLHFSDNSVSRPERRDRAAKIRPILQALEKTFRRGYRLGARISFDEGMVPNRSRYNPVRVYMAAKPNKWGTKFFLTCCADTAYCSRVEVYCGAEEKTKQPRRKRGEPKSDPPPVIAAIVVRNITKALKGMPAKRLIVTDNYYTSVLLALKLHSLGFYTVGTVRTNRLGWCDAITYKQKERPKSVDRGTYRLAFASNLVEIQNPPLVAVSWMDSKPVNFLASGCATTLAAVTRREKDGSITEVVCPQLVKDYHEGMGGVDVHDQLRLQRYSIQKCLRYRKYYKSLFLGLVDMALINGFIVHSLVRKQKDEKPLKHAEYMNQLQKALLGLCKEDGTANMNAENLIVPSTQPATHALVPNPDMYKGADHNKRRAHLCKVCSALTESKQKSFESSWYCKLCSINFGGHVALCDVPRRTQQGNTLTCSQIWHTEWANGTAIPKALRGRIRFRRHKAGNSQSHQ